MTTTTTPIDTKSASRRAVHYHCFNCLKADLDRIQRAHDAGTLTSTGNWTPAQNLWHCAKFMQYALDGFPSSAPAPVRWIAALIYKRSAVKTDKPVPAGFKLPKQASFLLPPDDIAFDDAMASLRNTIARLDNNERFTHPSPLLGRLAHDEWTTLQLKHCMLHLSFLHTGDE